MVAIMREGFEFGTNDLLNTGSIGTTHVRSGTYALQGTDAAAWMYHLSDALTQQTEFYFRAAFYIASGGLGTVMQPIINFLSLGGATSSRITYQNGTWDLDRGTTTMASGSKVIVEETWYLLEFYGKYANSGGVYTLRIDGSEVATYSGDTYGGSYPGRIGFGTFANDTNTWWDDVGVNDVTGANDVSWLGDGKIILIKPNGAGASTDLTPSAGSNYQCVDDLPYDSDTTYVESDVNLEDDLYNLEACGLGSVDILQVQAIAMARKVGASTLDCQTGVYAGSTEDWSASISPTTNYTYCKGDIHRVNPDDSAAWAVADIDALQAGFKVVT